jgi:dihydroxyacetone kinase-like protein
MSKTGGTKMETIKKAELKKILESITATMEKAKEELIALDALVGDGDLGLTMCKGFQAIRAEFDKIDEPDMGKLIMKLGMKMNSEVPSTMGTLVSICFVKAGTKAKGKTELNLADLVEMGRAALQGVMERGQSKVGDKTMLDALNPAVEALAAASEARKSLAEAQEAAYQAAAEGTQKTKAMKSVHGRAAYYSEKSIGRQDPGATAMMYIIKGIANACAKA